MSCCKEAINKLDSCEYYILSAVIPGPDTIIASEYYLGVRRKGNPPCNAEDNLRAGLIVIEA